MHAFRPTELRAMVEAAGFDEVRLRGEELLANAHGWLLRTLEASAEPTEVPFAWRLIAFRSYLALQRVDSALLEPHLPPELFYNLVLSARRPPDLRAGGRPTRTPLAERERVGLDPVGEPQFERVASGFR